MPDLTITVTDDGKIGTLPEPLQKFLDGKIDEAYGRGKAKGVDEGKVIASNPAELERLKTLELENSKLREKEAEQSKNFDEAKRIVAERHAKELEDREKKLAETEKALTFRTKRVMELTAKDIRAAALEHGARKESLDELETLLMGQIGLDDTLQPFVKDQSGKAKADKDGKPVTIGALVAEYLAAKPHHKAAPSGRGGGMTGGRSFMDSPPVGEKAEAFDAVAKNPSVSNVARAFAHVGKR